MTLSYDFDKLSASPLYLQLADALRKQIESGAAKPGERLTPELEIAEEYGLARGTVRQAMQILVQQGLVERTRRRGTFVADSSVKTRPTVAGIVIPYLRDSLTADMMRGVESILRRNAYSLIFGSSEGRLDVEEEQIQRLQRDNVGGIILFPVSLPDEASTLAQTLAQEIPVVTIDRKIPGFATSGVYADNAGGAHHAIDHLIALGHRRIVCVGHAGPISTVEERVRGYEQAMRAASLSPAPVVAIARRRPTPEGEPPVYGEEDLEPVEQLLRSAHPPTALFCLNDFVALGVMRHAMRRGFNIPDDLSIVGFDDIPLAAHVSVPLTTVSQPKFEIGAQAASLLLEMMASREAGQRIIILPTELVVRASTAAPALPRLA